MRGWGGSGARRSTEPARGLPGTEPQPSVLAVCPGLGFTPGKHTTEILGHLQAQPQRRMERNQPCQKHIFLCSLETELRLVSYCSSWKSATSFSQLSLPMASLWCHCSMIPQVLKAQSSHPQRTGRCSHRRQRKIKWAFQTYH